MKTEKRIILAFFLVLSLTLCGCSDLRNTFSLFWKDVEKTEENSHTFTSFDEEWKMPAANFEGKLFYFSSNEKVASVSEDGTVRPVSNGNAIITAAAYDGSFITSASVSVALKNADKKTETKSEKLRGVWVSTVWNIDFPSDSGLSEKELKSEIDEIMKNAASWNLNAVFFQVRPMSDALYESEYFPATSFVSGKQGESLPFDILEYAVSAAHENGLELHAWINPFRISFSSLYGADTEKLAENNPARLHPEYTVEYKNALYYNPGLPEVRKLVTDGVSEIVKNYDVDGIHFDDYFYPSGSSEKGAFDDSASYEKYGDGLALDDWRRENVNTLIKEVHDAVKSIKPDCAFGVSPGGIWATAENNKDGVSGLGNTSQTYYDVFADTKKWVEEKTVDYICPQIYWHTGSSIAPFEPIAKWWDELCSKAEVDLYVGIAAYKGEDTAAYQNPEEIKKELECLSALSSCRGEVYFSYSSLKKNLAGVVNTLKEVYGEEKSAEE